LQLFTVFKKKNILALGLDTDRISAYDEAFFKLLSETLTSQCNCDLNLWFVIPELLYTFQLNSWGNDYVYVFRIFVSEGMNNMCSPLQTVSTTPRARPLEATEQSATMETAGEVSTLQQVRTSGGEDWSDGCRSPLSPGPGFVFPGVLRNTEKEPTEKRKKWSLGGFFRRRKKDVGSESSSQDEEDFNVPRKGFLARRRSRREKRKSRTNKTVGTFDHIVVNPLTQTLKPPVHNEVGSAADEVNGCARDANINPVLREKDSQQTDDVRRSRSREPRQGGSIDRLSSRSSRESYQRHARQDSSLSRNSSGGSGSLDQGSSSRRGRLGAVKARAEALRDRQKAESSSEEGEFPTGSPLARFKSDDMLPVSIQRDGSLNRKSRVARTERYIKRLSRDEEGIIKKEAAEIELQRQQRLCKSDAEGSLRPPVNKNKFIPFVNRWAAIPAGYRESGDLEHPKLYMRPSSTTPSPGHSPLIRPKNIVHYTKSAPPCPEVGYDTSTSAFPPSHSIHYATPVATNSLDRKTPQNYVRAVGSSHLLPSNRSVESIPNVGIPRARINDYRQTRQIFEHGTSGRSDREYFEFQQPSQRSLSYDSSINRAMPKCGSSSSGPSPVPDSKDVRVVQFPVTRLQPSRSVDSKGGNMSSGFVAVKNGPPPPPPRDPQRRLLCVSSGQQDPARPMSFACDGNNHNRYPLQLEHQQQANLTTTSVSPFTHPQIHHQGGADSTFSDIPWASNGQGRSNSDNQLATLHFGHHNMLHPHAYNPTGHTRQSVCTPESVNHSCYQNQYSGHGNKFIIRTVPSPDVYNSPPKQSGCMGQQQQFQYFADRQPRSRRPIHVQYHVTNVSNSDQPYLSDSQVVLMKPPHQNQDKIYPVQHTTDVWRQKDQEGGAKQRKSVAASPRLSVHPASRNDRSRSNSPRPKELPTGLAANSDSAFRAAKTTKIRVPPLSMPAVCPADSLSSLSGNSDISSPMQMSSSSKFTPDIPAHESHQSSGSMDSLRRKENLGSHRPLSMVLEKSETSDQLHQHGLVEDASCHKRVEHEQVQQHPQSVPNSVNVPPAPPARIHSRQSSSSSIEAADCMSEDAGALEDIHRKKGKSRNLEDALTELEAIYQSLKLGDEDLLDRAERRDLPVPHQKLNDGTPIIASALSLSSGASRGAESDSGYNFGWGSSFESVFDHGDPPRRKRAPSIRRSGIPDKVMDDMAYRRLHSKERPGSHYIRNVMSQSGSYLSASPAAAAAEINPEDLPQKPLYASANHEPDITLDDVVFRNIRHANNTLKVLDPQPPFGIPVGPIAPASNSDYLHAVPSDSYRSMFKPRRMPDIVKDDLAYRNLRKDSLKEPLNLRACTDDMSGILKNTFFPSTHSKNDNFSMRKRRAVRSLSANIQSLVNREPLTLSSRSIDQDFEKAQSLSDLPDALQVAQKILEGKEVIGGGSIKLCNLTGSSNEPSVDEHGDSLPFTHESRRCCPSPGSSWIERANLTDFGDRLSLFTSTSTETLTDSRANLMQHDPVSNKRSSWQQKLKVFMPSNTVRDYNEDASVPGDMTATQRPPPPPTPERNSSRLLSEYNKGDIHQRPQPPPTPERSSSRRPSLDQNKILSTLVHTPPSPTPDRESPRQTQDHGRTRVCKPDETVIAASALDKSSARNSLAIRSGKSSPQTDLSLPIPEVVPGSPIDERQLEELLIALAREAKATSDKLERDLQELGGNTVPHQEEVVAEEQAVGEEHKHPYMGDRKPRSNVGKKLPQSHEENKLQEQISEIQEGNKKDNRVTGFKNLQPQFEVQHEQDQGQQSSQGPQIHDNKQLFEVCTEYELAPKSFSAENEGVISQDMIDLGDEVPSVCHVQTESLSIKTAASEIFTEQRKTKESPYIENISPENSLEQTPSKLIEYSKAAIKEQTPGSPPEVLESSRDADKDLQRSVTEPLKESAVHHVEAESSSISADRCNHSDTLPKTVRATSSSPVLNQDHEGREVDTRVTETESQEQGGTVHEVLETEVTAQSSEMFPLSVAEHFTQNTAAEEHSLPSSKLECIDHSLTEDCTSVATSVEVFNESVAKDFDNLSTDQQVAKSCVEGEDLGASAPPSAAAGWYCFSPLADPSTVLVACSYCIACAHQIAGLDFLTVLGIVLAMVSLVVALIL